MQRKSFGNMQCPIARSLERVGEWWSILILRDAFRGLTRFDQFQKSLDIAPNMLTRRLTALVKAGLLERRRYSERPPRDEYVLTERGRDFRPVALALLAWGNGWVRTNGDLQQLPTESRFLPMLVHLRSPAMAWAGVIDDADWIGFWQAAGGPVDLPESLESMFPDPDMPWLEHDRVTALNQAIKRQRLRRRGSYRYTYERRGVDRRIS